MTLGPAASGQPAPEPAEVIAAAVQACPGVAALSGGRFGEVATYLPGRRIAGIRLGDEVLAVHVVAHWGVNAPQLAAQIRAACAGLSDAGRIDVTVEDVQLPQAPAPTADPA